MEQAAWLLSSSVASHSSTFSNANGPVLRPTEEKLLRGHANLHQIFWRKRSFCLDCKKFKQLMRHKKKE